MLFYQDTPNGLHNLSVRLLREIVILQDGSYRLKQLTKIIVAKGSLQGTPTLPLSLKKRGLRFHYYHYYEIRPIVVNFTLTYRITCSTHVGVEGNHHYSGPPVCWQCSALITYLKSMGREYLSISAPLPSYLWDESAL